MPAEISIGPDQFPVISVFVKRGRADLTFGPVIGFEFITLREVHYFLVLLAFIVSCALEQKPLNASVFITPLISLCLYEHVLPEGIFGPARLINNLTVLIPLETVIVITNRVLYITVVFIIQCKIGDLVPVKPPIKGLGKDQSIILFPGLGPGKSAAIIVYVMDYALERFI